MEESVVPPRRAARRNSGKDAPKSHTKAVAIADEIYIRLESTTSKSRITKSKYASAAIAYFIDNGLDPTKAGVSEIAQLRTLIGESTYEVRKQNADIGNRLVAIMRTWEANQYKFLQTQQGGLLGYLEDIEANILNHQVAVESQLLAPLFERVVRNGIDAHLTRMLTEVLMLKLKDSKYSPEELKSSTTDYDAQRDRRLVSEVRKLLETATVAAPKATQKPVLAVPIVGAPAKPAGTTAPATAPSAAPKS